MAGAAAAAGVFLRSNDARAFGELPAEYADLIPEERRAQSVLEVFLSGGISHYESFYTVLGHGQSDGTGWYLHLNNGELDASLTDCNFPAGEPLTQEFHQDSEGVPVSLGPFALPLRQRGDVLDRLRICVTAHAALPHEVAIPLALTGRRFGHPRGAGLGTHIQRHFLDREGEAVLRAMILMPSGQIVNDLTRGAFAIGAHPAAARPLPVLIERAGDLLTLLRRDALGNPTAHDQLRFANLARMRTAVGGTGARAASLRAEEGAAQSVAQSGGIASLLDPDVLSPVSGVECGVEEQIDLTRMSMRTAAHLLTRSENQLRYVSVIDAGFAPQNPAGGYDTHTDNCDQQGRNALHVLTALLENINRPGEGDPNKIDLDKTMVIINTEFGRTPHGENPDEAGRWGRGHWPNGYPVLYLGGPVRAANKGIYGATDGGATAITAVTPAEHRIAALLAMGIWPFHTDGFNVSDSPDAASEGGAAQTIIERVFGAV